MPRDGAGVYSHPFPDVAEGTTIESAVFNGNTADVEQDLNTPRPIIAGGTGASDAHTALINLHGEESGQVVTNYDIFPFVAGSFRSSAGATSSPLSSDDFAGICYLSDPSFVFIEARSFNSGKMYVRRKAAGVWGAWAEQIGGVTDLDARYVNVAGDTMTGSLSFAMANPGIGLDKTASGGSNTLYGFTNSLQRWVVTLGDSIAESGSSAGSNFNIYHYNDAGTYLGTALSISRASGTATFGGMLNGSAGVTSYLGGALTQGAYYFGTSGTKYLIYDGTNFTLNGGALTVSGNVISNVAVGAPIYYSGGIQVLTAAGNYTTLTAPPGGGSIIMGNTADPNNYYRTPGSHSFQTVAGTLNSVTGLYANFAGFRSNQGTNGVQSGNYFNIEWTTSAHLWINTSYIGGISIISDYRAKKDVADLPSMWETVKALNPISYTHKAFSPQSHLAHQAKQAKEGDEPSGPLIPDDDIERWGFMAHELQEAMVPSAAWGEKDSPNGLQTPNAMTVIAALTKALQEAMARIEALEAA
jgi:hypothetical protein